MCVRALSQRHATRARQRARRSCLLKIRLVAIPFYVAAGACGGDDAIEPRIEPDWTVGVPIPERVQELHAAVWRGDIYIAGGLDSLSAESRRAYRFIVAQNRWERIADLPEARHHMPLVVANDTLYAIGGYGGGFVGRANLWIYTGNAWEARASLPAGRGASAAGVVRGRIVVVGGTGPDRPRVDSVAIYEPATNSWRLGSPIPTPRDHLTAGVVNDVLYAIAGRNGPNFDMVEAYDLSSNGWTTRAPMPSRRGGLGAAVLNGRIHTLGGETATSVFANHEVYDPQGNAWSIAPALPTARHGLAVAAVSGRLYSIGGGPAAGLAQTNVVEVYLPPN